MRKADRVTAIALLALSAYIVTEGLRLQYILDGVPGPGFAPFWVGAFLGVMAFILLLTTLVGLKGKSDQQAPITWGGLRYVVGVTGFSVVAGVLVSFLGMVLSMGLLSGALARFLGAKNWVTPIGLAVAVPVVFYFLFVHSLGVPFPKGVFGF